MNTDNEIYNFCTIFDSGYYSKGLALYHSLQKVCNFHLYIFTPDKRCIQLLEDKNLPNSTVINFNNIEDEKLLAVKSGRDTAEYYWTIKASSITYLFEKLDLKMVTYVDADTFFYSSPEPFFNELGDKSVLITPHNFSLKYKNEIKNGLYNAGYITFKNDKLGNEALRWWEKRCIEWCFRKKADGKFGDQMYLNELSKFEGVQTLNHKGILANWNVQQYTFINTNNSIEGVISLSNRFKVIFYHFHYLKFYNNGKVELGRKYLPIKVVELFYKPYIRCLYELAPNDSHGATKFPLNWKTPILFVKRKIEKTYNIISVADIIEE